MHKSSACLCAAHALMSGKILRASDPSAAAAAALLESVIIIVIVGDAVELWLRTSRKQSALVCKLNKRTQTTKECKCFTRLAARWRHRRAQTQPS